MAETAAEAAYRAALDEIERVKREGGYELDLSSKTFHALDRIPPEVAEVAGLTVLNLDLTGVSDIEPISKVEALQLLELGETAVSDLAPLASLTKLHTLGLTRTPVADLTPLAGLSKLQMLWLSYTPVADLGPLRSLKALKKLGLTQTSVANLDPIEGLDELEWLLLGGAPLADFAVIRRLGSLECLDLSGTAFSDLAAVSKLAKLQMLWLSYTAVGNLAPISNCFALRKLWLDHTSVTDVSPLVRLTSLTELTLQGSNVSDLRPIRSLKQLGTGESPGLTFSSTPSTRLDAQLARLAEIDETEDRARQTLAYLNTLPPWPEPYTPKARPDGLPPEPIGGSVEPSPPTVQTAEAQIRALLRNALVTRVSAAAFAEQIAEALRGVPATNGNELAPALQLMAEVGEVLGAIGRQSADAQHEENLLRLRISQLESLVDRLTVQLKDAEEARKAAEALAQKDGFTRSYRKSLGVAAGAGTVTLIAVGVPTAAVYFLGAEHGLVKSFLTVVGRLPKP